MRVRISHLVNALTRQALYETVPGYVGKETDFAAVEEEARRLYGVDRLLRFDLGENARGCSPTVAEFLRHKASSDLIHSLSGYPETSRELRTAIAELHHLPPEWIVLGTGVVSFISILCHTFYEWGDRVLLPTPTFFVIEEYSLRSGALPIYMPLSPEHQFAWTPAMTARIIDQFQRVPVKMLWLVTPNNPTGQAIPLAEIEKITAAAQESFTMVVVDEAYGEFTDDDPVCASASCLLEKFDNLIVLRSFSKAYGLAGMRIGYAMMSSSVVHSAVSRQMEYFPVTRLSIEMAAMAVRDQAYLEETRQITRTELPPLQEQINAIPGFESLPSRSNIFLCRKTGWPSAELLERLKKHGVLVANADTEGLNGQGWVRITCRGAEENNQLAEALRRL